MTGLSVLDRDGFLLRPQQVGTTMHLEFGGSADSEAHVVLPGYFKLLHSEAERAGITEVVVDVHELYFIDSSCFKALVIWIDLLNGMPPHRRYSIRFLKDPNLRWQTRSFDALHRMCMSHVTVEDWAGAKS